MHAIRRRHLLAAAAIAACVAGPVQAQGFPDRPVRVIVPFGPGGGTDNLVRLIEPHVRAALGQPLVIENRAGAGGTIGSEMVARAPADGYTVLIVDSSFAINPSLFPRLPYDSEKDFAPVSLLATGPVILLAHPSLPVTSLQELVAMAKARPGALNYASGGNGASTHLAGELLKMVAGIDLVHVPYRGTGPALADLVAENVDIYFSDASVWPMVQQGQLRLLAVSSSTPWATSPQTPSVGSVVPDFDTANWYGVTAPPGTPDAIRAQLAGEIAKIVVRPEIAEMLRRIGFEPAPMPPAQFAAFVRTELETWRSVVRAANIRAD